MGHMKVGRTYEVQCIFATGEGDGISRYVPCMGAPHIDPPSLGEDGTQMHWHLDYRFMTDEEMKAFLADDPAYNPGVFISDPARAKLRNERRKMLREFRNTVFIGVDRREFERPYVGKKVKCGKCPHQGFDLTEDSVRFAEDGRPTYLCPGHGLCIDVETKRVRSSFDVAGREPKAK